MLRGGSKSGRAARSAAKAALAVVFRSRPLSALVWSCSLVVTTPFEALFPNHYKGLGGQGDLRAVMALSWIYRI